MKYGQISAKSVRRDSTLDPLEIFARATQRGEIEQLRGPQQEALEKWHADHRAGSDVLLSLDTGGGKSLVGLLMAQSLVNESRLQGLYLCPTIQLIRQIEDQAVQIGIEVDTYYKGQHTNEARYREAKCVCLTTYHAVFNGFSHFRSDEIGSCIFDDSHVAESVIRGCFSLSWQHGQPAYSALSKVFSEYFDTTPFASKFGRHISGKATNEEPPLLVPLHASSRRANQLLEILQACEDDAENKYAWAHLQNHVPQLLFLFGGGRVEVTPWRLPIEQCVPYRSRAQRIYLSATLPSAVTFKRTFGRSPDATIEPKGKTNAAQRVFAFPADGATLPDTANQARETFSDKQKIVLVPSKHAAKPWSDFGAVLKPGSSEKELQEFRSGTRDCLILVGRYDGIDFPGDECHVMFVEGLPRGESLVSSYFASALGFEVERTIRIADRLAQGFGRIFRSNRDHGLVFVVDPFLASWLRQPNNYRHLPDLLQRQLLLSMELSRLVEDPDVDLSWCQVFDDVVGGDAEWDETYQKQIGQFEVESFAEQAAELEEVELAESDVFRMLWSHDYAKASDAAASVVERWNDHLSSGHKAFLFAVASMSAFLDDDHIASLEYAASARKYYPPFGRLEKGKESLEGTRAASTQSQQIVARGIKQVVDGCDEVVNMITSTKQDQSKTHHAGLVQLGRLLGLWTEPVDEKTGGRGPDVLWRGGTGTSGIVLEAKLNKKPGSSYGKNDFIQLTGSANWARKYLGGGFRLFIVGELRQVENNATVPEEAIIADVSVFIDIATRLKHALQEVERVASQEHIGSYVEEALFREGLLFDQMMKGSLTGTAAVDLQG